MQGAGLMTNADNIKSEMTQLRAAAADIARLRAVAIRELEEVRKTRVETKQYQQQVITRAQSEAQRLILHTRLALKKEAEEVRRVTGEEMQRILSDMRILRVTAQEELWAQRAYSDAAKIKSMGKTSPPGKEATRKRGEAVGV